MERESFRRPLARALCRCPAACPGRSDLDEGGKSKSFETSGLQIKNRVRSGGRIGKGTAEVQLLGKLTILVLSVRSERADMLRPDAPKYLNPL